MIDRDLPAGLRHVLVHVAVRTVFPPPANSPADVALLRAANRALQRKAQGIEDTFLFVVDGPESHEREDCPVWSAISGYGFPSASVIHISTDGEQDFAMCGDPALEEVSDMVAAWLDRNHRGALAAFTGDYDATGFWWSGIEYDADRDGFEWPFEIGDFARALPDTQAPRAATWLTILGHAVGLAPMGGTARPALAVDLAAAWAATLCEWLHGFEAASGNGYNRFDSSYPPALMPSGFYLGYEFARHMRSDLDTACDTADADVDELDLHVLKTITGHNRWRLRSALSSFFGSTGALLWALHCAIWPDFNEPMIELAGRMLASAGDLFAQEGNPWQFVSDGWCDAADDC